MTRDELLALMDHFSASVLHRMEYEEGYTRIVLEKAPIAPVAPLTAVAPAAVPAMAAPAPAAPTATAEAPQAEGSVIKAPLVGTFYAAPPTGGCPLCQGRRHSEEERHRVHPGGHEDDERGARPLRLRH